MTKLYVGDAIYTDDFESKIPGFVDVRYVPTQKIQLYLYYVYIKIKIDKLKACLKFFRFIACLDLNVSLKIYSN